MVGWSQSLSASSGYNQVLIVPVGATSIHIEEVAASRNFLGEDSLDLGELGAAAGKPVALAADGGLTPHSGEERPW